MSTFQRFNTAKSLATIGASLALTACTVTREFDTAHSAPNSPTRGEIVPTLNAREQARANIQSSEQMQRFLRELSVAKALGAQLDPTAGFCGDISSTQVLSYLLSNQIIVSYAPTPVSWLGAQAYAERFLPVELRQSKCLIPVCSLQILKVGELSSDRNVSEYVVIDHLCPDQGSIEPGGIVWRGILNNRDSDSNISSAKELVRIANERLKLHSAAIFRLPVDTNLLRPIELVACEHAHDTWQRMAELDINLSFTLQTGTGLLSESSNFSISSHDLCRLGDHSLRFNAPLINISLSTENTIPGLPPSSPTIFGEPLVQSLQDQFGNRIVIVHNQFLQPSDIVHTRWTVYPHTAPLGTPEGTVVELTFDASRAGLDRMDVFQIKVQPPLAVLGPYTILGDSNNPQMPQISGNFLAVINGIAAIEREFGIGPGELIKDVRLINEDSHNGSFSTMLPDTITVHDENLFFQETTFIVAQHETLHGIDHSINPAFSSGNIKELYQQFSDHNPLFLYCLNESLLLRSYGDDHAGHAQDNEREFWASFLNGILSPEWENHIKSFDPNNLPSDICEAYSPHQKPTYKEFLEMYLLTINTFAERIASATNPASDSQLAVRSDAPIHRTLREKANIVKQMIDSAH